MLHNNKWDSDNMAAAKKTTKSRSKKTSEVTLELPAVADITQSKSLHKELKKHIKGKGEICTLNASEVERITTPCIQLILSAAKTLEESKGKLIVSEPSEALQNAFLDLGLESELNEWSNVS